MATNLLRCEMRNPPQYVPHLHTIIMLHDKGSNGLECCEELFSAEIRPVLNLPLTVDKLYDCCRWVFPCASYLDGSGPGGHQWFETPDLGNPQDSPNQQPALERSIDDVLDIIREEEASVSRAHIFIGGFGQGFAVAAGAFFVDGGGDFAGLIGLNGWLPYSVQLKNGMTRDDTRAAWINRARALLAPSKFTYPPAQPYAVNGGGLHIPPSNDYHSCPLIRRIETRGHLTSIFMAHPHYDRVIDCAETSLASDVFEKMGWGFVDWKVYQSDNGSAQDNHGINTPRGIEDLANWLNDRFANCPRHPRGGHFLSFIRARILDWELDVSVDAPEEELVQAVKDFLHTDG